LPYLNLAIASNAAYLVTRDKDLLDLTQEAAFVARFPQLRIVEPVTFLSAMRAMTGR
jgi:predicted nucleic acid-binding protein